MKRRWGDSRLIDTGGGGAVWSAWQGCNGEEADSWKEKAECGEEEGLGREM